MHVPARATPGQKPVARDDTYAVAVNGELDVARPGVLANDENNPTTAILVKDVDHGSLTLNDEGSFTYRPTRDFLGEDTFTYKAKDKHNNESDIATVTLTVLPAYRIPDAELLNEEFEVLTGWSGSSSTLLHRDDVDGEGVVYWMKLEGEDHGKIVLGDPWPTSSDAGFGYDDVLGHWTSLAGYGCYEMVVSYINGRAKSDIDVSLFLNTGLTGPSGYPSNDGTNDTYWDNGWTTLSLRETKTLRVDFNAARAFNISDNKEPHTGGGLSWPDEGWYAINYRDRNEISNIGFQVADFDGDALGQPIQIALNVLDPTAAQVRLEKAHVEDGRVALEWETASEVGTAGFYVVRRDSAGRATTLGGGMLPGLLDSPQGGSYRVVDSDVKAGETYTYQLIEVEAGGRKRSCGTWRVTVEKPLYGAGRAAAMAKRKESGKTFAYSHTARPRPAKVRERVDGRSLTAHHMRRHKRPRASDVVKIGVKEDGLYYVAAAQLAPLLGESPEAISRLIQRHHLSLSCQGEPVAYLPAPGGAGFYFYGQGIESIYTDENLYWLRSGVGVVMDEAGESGAQPHLAPRTFTETLHAEEDLTPATGIFTDPEADFWLWDYLISGYVQQDRKSFTIHAPGAAQMGEATLCVHLKGATNTEAEPDHHALIFLNDTLIGEGRWDGLQACSLTFSINPAMLHPGENTVTVEGVLDPGVPYDVFYVDSFDLVYERLYEAVDDRLLCRAEGHDVLTIGGFTRPEILVLDVTRPKCPTHVVGTTVEKVDGAYRVSFAPLGPANVYLATTPEAAKFPSTLVADEPSRLRQRANRADYLVVAPAALREPAQVLADYRTAQRLATMVVTLEDIYDEFNHGIASPRAIQKFLAYARKKWRRKPRYLVLAGSGTYDYKDHLGSGENLVPPLMMATGYGLFATDRLFAPEVAIGRLPAKDAAELETLIQKIIAYERSSGEWARRIVFAADNPDESGNYHRDSDELAEVVPAGYATTKVYLSNVPLNVARQELIQGFNAGALVINYIGHGGLDCLAHEGLLTMDDVGALNNAHRLPVVTTLTCLTGRFAVPGYDCLGEALVLHPGGGAVAFWGPAGLPLNRQSKALGKEFFRAALRRGKRTLGDAILKAHQRCSEKSSALLDLYNLLGDPGLMLRRAK